MKYLLFYIQIYPKNKAEHVHFGFYNIFGYLCCSYYKSSNMFCWHLLILLYLNIYNKKIRYNTGLGIGRSESSVNYSSKEISNIKLWNQYKHIIL